MIAIALILAAIAAAHRGQGGPIPAVVIPPNEEPLIKWFVDNSGAMQLLGE